MGSFEVSTKTAIEAVVGLEKMAAIDADVPKQQLLGWWRFELCENVSRQKKHDSKECLRLRLASSLEVFSKLWSCRQIRSQCLRSWSWYTSSISVYLHSFYRFSKLSQSWLQCFDRWNPTLKPCKVAFMSWSFYSFYFVSQTSIKLGFLCVFFPTKIRCVVVVVETRQFSSEILGRNWNFPRFSTLGLTSHQQGA